MGIITNICHNNSEWRCEKNMLNITRSQHFQTAHVMFKFKKENRLNLCYEYDNIFIVLQSIRVFPNIRVLDEWYINIQYGFLLYLKNTFFSFTCAKSWYKRLKLMTWRPTKTEALCQFEGNNPHNKNYEAFSIVNLALVAQALGCCPDGWKTVGQSCFKVSPGPLNWFDASQVH